MSPATEERSGRVPPHNLDAEVSVLGCILLRPEVLYEVVPVLRGPEDFYHPGHQAVYAAALFLSEHSRPVDETTVAAQLADEGKLERLGGIDFLISLESRVGTAENVAYHARIVRDKALARQLIATASEVVGRGYSDAGEVSDLLDEAEQRIFELSQGSERRSYVGLKELLKGTLKNLQTRQASHSGVTGVPTGFRDLDRLTAGLQPGDLVVVAARPSMGKSALCANIAQYAAIEGRHPVLLFSLEMSADSLTERMLASEGRVESTRLRSGFLDSRAFSLLISAANRLAEAPFYIDDSSAPTVLEIRAKARRFAADQKLFPEGERRPGLILVDYLQLIRPATGGRGERNREQEISEISRGLKALAKELHFPVVALSQLNRSPEKREDKRPMLADLRESGAIEQDADVIAFIFREDFYKREASEKTGIAEVIVAKQRNGPTGTVELHFHDKYTRFDDMRRDEEP